MPQGLILRIGANVKEALTALKELVFGSKVAGNQIEKSFGKITLPVTKGIKETRKEVKKLTPEISVLGKSIETLRAQALARKSFLLTETDFVKIKQYNREIKLLEAEIIRLQSLGTGGIGIAGAATKGFSALRNVANILPGIGIAGIFSGLISVFSNVGSKADETAKKLKELLVPIEDIRRSAGAGVEEELSKVSALSNAVLNQSLSYKERNNALNQLKEINKGYFGDLTVETAALGLLKTRVNEYTEAIINAAVIKAFSDQIGKLNVELQAQEKTFNDLGKGIKAQNDQVLINQKLIASGDNAAKQQTDGLIQRVTIAIGKFNEQGKVVGKLRNQMFELRTAIQEAVNTSLEFKPLDAKEVSIKDNSKDVITQAKKVADFLKDAFVITYQFSPLDTPAISLQKAQKFLDQVSKGDLKLLVRIEGTFSEPPTRTEAEKFVDPIEEQLKKMKRMAGEIFVPAGQFDPSIIRAQWDFEDQIKQLARLEARAVATAAVINGILSPAFSNLFQAIQAGENPLKAFFDGLGQAVLQLIQKLIQAAITAAILAAIIPGGAGTAGGFGAQFAKLFGFQFAGGGLVSGPTLGMIGEGAGTSRSNPEVIAPLDQLKSMLSDLNVGNQIVQVAVTGRLRGRDMALQNARTSRTNRRLGA